MDKLGITMRRSNLESNMQKADATRMKIFKVSTLLHAVTLRGLQHGDYSSTTSHSNLVEQLLKMGQIRKKQ